MEEVVTELTIDKTVLYWYGSILVMTFSPVLIRDGLMFAHFIIPVYVFLFLWSLFKKYLEVYRQNNWVSCQAHILSGKLVKKHCLGILMVECYYPKIVYLYQVDSMKYQSNSFASFQCNQLLSFENAQVILKEYKSSKSVVIYYNPINPSESVIRRGFSEKYKYLLLGSVVYNFLFFGIGLSMSLIL